MKRKYSQSMLVMLFAMLMLNSCQKNELTTIEDTVIEESLDLKSATFGTNYIVLSKSETLSENLKKELSQYGEIISTVPEIGLVVVQPSQTDFEKKASKLKEVQGIIPDFNIKYYEPSLVKSEALIGVSEPWYPYQWNMRAIYAPEAWNAGYTGQGTKIFILDSGIDAEHPDLAPNLNTELSISFIEGEDFSVEDGEYFNHGSHVAGIAAAASNGFGIVGVAPDAEIVAVKVLSEYTGSGPFSAINAGIVYAAINGADVINMSLGATFNKNGKILTEEGWIKIPAVYIQNIIQAQKRAISFAIKNGSVVVTSAGNDAINADGNGSMMILPADFENVITVSATAPNYWYGDLMQGIPTNFDVPASYTQYGKSLIDIAAPGGDFDYASDENLNWQLDMILSAGSGGLWFGAGTSMAAPHVAGVAALIIAANDGDISPDEVRKQILKTADKIDTNGKSSYFGKGRVNAYRAVTE
jgi:subtilisin family serine protease